MDIKTSFGEKLKFYRTKRRLSQEVLSEKIGVTVKHLSAVERGVNFVSADLLEKLSNFFEIPIASFFTTDGEYFTRDIHTDTQLQAMREKELKLWIISNNKISRLDQAFAKTNLPPDKKKTFREKLLEYTLFLIGKIDDNTITNNDIRKKIEDLKNIDPRITYGQAQRVLNVCLKQYCFISNKLNAIKELDSPYDIYNGRMLHMGEEDYRIYQNFLERENRMRILNDLEYDDFRITVFLS
jgi:transcriptional regulator with XRE-family HTH domain